MNRIHSKYILFFKTRASIFLFASFWLLGILFGTLLAAGADDTYFSMMRRAAGCSVSIVGLAVAVFLPFLIVAFADYLSSNWLIYLIGFLKAFFFSACAVSLTGSFGSAAWLVSFLFQFSDCLTLPVFIWFSVRCLRQNGSCPRRFAFSFVWCLAIGLVDYFIISPFLTGLIGN